MVLVQNWPFSNFFFLDIICQENVFYDILDQKTVFLGHKNKKFKKSKNWQFFKGVSLWFWSKNGLFSNFFFWGNIGQEHLFYDIVHPENAFVAYKKKISESWKTDIFPKGLTYSFGPKLAIFPTFFFLGNIRQENVFYDILERKNPFLCYKNKKFKKSKNWHFFKGFNPLFWSNNGPFSNFFF